jgi:flagellar biosynthesis/type III secretory pathway chaperone
MEPQKIDKDSGREAAARLAESLQAELRSTESLLSCLEVERASIFSGDIAELERVCAMRMDLVEEVRERQQAAARAMAGLASVLEIGREDRLSLVIARLPRQEQPRLRRLRADINGLRRQVQALSEENRLCVAETLFYLDAALAAITGTGADAETYGDRRSKAAPALISSEI